MIARTDPTPSAAPSAAEANHVAVAFLLLPVEDRIRVLSLMHELLAEVKAGRS
jgi:hypothetical protein